MPVSMREGFDKNDSNSKNQSFHDNEEVFYCETTKEVFREYEEYFRHVMLINSTIWACESTGRENLTYAEALKSERKARKKLESFKDILRGPALLIAECCQQSAYREVFKYTYEYIRDRYFVGETVQACTKLSSTYHSYIVLEIVKPNKFSVDEVCVPLSVKYKLKRADKTNENTIDVPPSHIRRGRLEFSHENLQMFLKENCHRVNGIIQPKPESYKKFVTDKNVTAENIYIGKLPEYKASKQFVKKEDKDKKQAVLSKYFKNNDEPGKTEAKINREKQMKADMEKEVKEREEKRIKRELQRELIEEECNLILKKTDDLERRDQKLLPIYNTVKTLIPTKYFGDFLMIREFLHSFVGILSGYSEFKNNISFFDMTRALTTREVCGPLSDILLVLLGTIFDLQKEEEEECTVEYIRPKFPNKEPHLTILQATKTQEFVKKYLAFKLNELPLDAQTISEVLRLHFLASGAGVNDKAERWRIMYRNGYYSSEDPGLGLRMDYPHILRALKMYTIYQLPIGDTVKIINCLINQILTYSGTINVVEERIEQMTKARSDLRTLLSAENKRVNSVVVQKKRVQSDYNCQCSEADKDDLKKKDLENKLNKQVADINALGDREKKKFDTQLDKIQNSIFDYMVFLGTDRAYRKYYVYESIPGIFIEHETECYDTCLSDPPKNWEELIDVPHNRKDLRSFLSKHHNLEPEKSKLIPIKIDKEANKENQLNFNGAPDSTSAIVDGQQAAIVNGDGLTNGDVKIKTEADVVVIKKEPTTQYDLYMCTGDPKNCIVHDENNSDRVRWSYIYTENEINELIESLNPFGDRESSLREHLISLKLLIINHVKRCPIEYINLNDDTNRFKRFKAQMDAEIAKRYSDTNFGFGLNSDINEVMFASLVEKILQFEVDITTGSLGKLKVRNIVKWRTDIQKNLFDPQGKIVFGVENKTLVVDPGENLGDTRDIESEDSSDDSISLHDSDLLRSCVKNLSTALLQIEQGIEQKFLKEPFGLQKEPKDIERMDQLLERGRDKLKNWESSLMHSTSYSQVFLHLNILHDSVKWQRSINKSNCTVCRRKSDPDKLLLCDECNAGTHMFCLKPILKSVPSGNWYCKKCQQSLGYKNKIAEEIEKQKKRKRHAFHLLDDEDNRSESSNSINSNSRTNRRRQPLLDSEIEAILQDDEENVGEETLNDEIEDDESEDDGNGGDDGEENDVEEDVEDEETNETQSQETDDDDDDMVTDTEHTDEDVCVKCSYDGGDISCITCKSVYHLECAELKRVPRSNWVCSKCKLKEEKKRKNYHRDIDFSEDDDEPIASKRSKPSTTTKRNSTRNSINAAEAEHKSSNNNSRRSRRNGEHLPLNGVALYELLEEIMKHNDSWPFLRPVHQFEVPDYYDIIKSPMDFAKIKSKLNMGQYRINEEILKDIQLVFRNCDTYNREGNEIYICGSNLEKFVIKKCKALNLPFIPSDMNA